MIIRLENNPKIVIRADQYPSTVTGYTGTQLQGSGATVVTSTGVNPVIYTVYTPIGGTATWGNIVGTLSDQADLQSALDAKVATTLFTTYTGDTSTLIGTKQDIMTFVASGGTALSQSGATLTIYSPTGGTAAVWGNITGTLSGQTDLQAALDLKLDESVYNSDMLIVTGAIDDNANDITYLSGQTDTKLNTTLFTTYTGDTSTLIGTKLDTSIFQTYTGTTAPATFLPITGLTGYWTSGQTVDYVTGYTPTLDGYWNSGQTVSYVQGLGYITGVTWNDVASKPDLWTTGQTVSYVTGLGYLTGVTFANITGAVSGNTNLQNALDAKLDTSVYQTYTGTTVPNTYVPLVYSGSTSVSTFTQDDTKTNLKVQQISDGNYGEFTVEAEQIVTNIRNVSGIPEGGFSTYNQQGITLGAFISGTYNSVLLTENGVTISKPIQFAGQSGVVDADLISRAYADTRYASSGLTTDFNTYTGTTAPAQFAPIDATADMWTSGQTQSYVTGLGYTTGYTFTQSGITEITQVGNDITIYVPPDSITGVTFSNITGAVSGNTNLQTALDTKLDESVYNSDMLIISDAIDANAADITYLSGQTDTKLATSLFTTYTGTTAPAAFLPITGLTGYWTSGQTVDYVTGYTPTLEWGNITGTLSGQTDLYDALQNKVDIPIYQDDLQTLGDAIDANATGITAVVASISTNLGITVTGGTNLGTGQGIFSGVTSNKLNAKSLKVGSGLSISGDTDSITITPTSAAQWGLITGTLSGQTDLQQALDNKVDIPIYQDDLQTLGDAIDANATGITTNYAAITGNTASIATKADKLATINSITASTYTTVDGDSNEILEIASGCTGITLHSGATTGFQVTFMNLGGQTITFSAQSGATLTSKAGAVTLVDAYGAVNAYKNGTVWRLTGDLT